MTITALLELRNRAAAERREAELKAQAEAEGQPTDDIHVEPGSVDWLYGDKEQRDQVQCYLMMSAFIYFNFGDHLSWCLLVIFIIKLA